MVVALHREVFPIDARLDDPVDRLQKIGAMRLDVESDQIGAQQAIHQLALPGANSEGLRIRPRNVPEDRDPRVRPLCLIIRGSSAK